jgi:hypothetical protein
MACLSVSFPAVTVDVSLMRFTTNTAGAIRDSRISGDENVFFTEALYRGFPAGLIDAGGGRKFAGFILSCLPYCKIKRTYSKSGVVRAKQALYC